MNAVNSVLLIEDDPGDAGLVTACIYERFGNRCAVRLARTLADGVVELRRGPTDIVLLDLGLPDSQGLDTYRELKGAAPRTPVVILSGQGSEEQVLEALRDGADDYLDKRSAYTEILVRTLSKAVHRRQVADRLHDSEARLRAIVDTADEGILRVDRDGWILSRNARAARLLGHDPIDANDGVYPMIRIQWYLAADDQAAVEELLRTPAGRRKSRELRLLNAGGSVRTVIVAAGGVASTDADVREVVLLLTDITDLQSAAQELLDLKRALEARVTERTNALGALNSELLALARAMAHDLHTPLNGIIGMTRQVLREAQSGWSAEAVRRLRLIDASAREMNALIDRLLSMNSLGGPVLQREALDLSMIARQIADCMTTSDDQRQVRWMIASGLVAEGDRALVTDVLRNLLGNAWKFTAHVEAAIIEVGRQQREDGVPEFFVRDNGVGFDMADNAGLFVTFGRLPNAAKFPGTGLGLAGVRQIVERHGGTVSAQGSPGAGARFSFTLPPATIPPTRT